MPFPDEFSARVVVVPYRDQWPAEFAVLAVDLDRVLGRLALAIDHVGSTSVPGLLAKSCIDIQVRVAAIVDAQISRPPPPVDHGLTYAFSGVSST